MEIGRYVESGDIELMKHLFATKECDFSAKSELGTTAAYLAVLHDRPGDSISKKMHFCFKLLFNKRLHVF